MKRFVNYQSTKAVLRGDSLKIIPVLDLLNGVVVRGVAGERKRYLPVESCLTASVQPLDVAKAIRDHWGVDWLYLADLDAITGKKANWNIYEGLVEAGFKIMLDAGLADLKQVKRMLECGVSKTVLGLETLPQIDFLDRARDTCSPEHLVFSVDMKNGKPLTGINSWRSSSAYEIAVHAIGCGYQELILLDLAEVGTGKGVSTLPLCKELKKQFPELKLIAGGGVKTSSDWATCRDSNVLEGLLVASALHNGRLTPEVVSHRKC